MCIPPLRLCVCSVMFCVVFQVEDDSDSETEGLDETAAAAAIASASSSSASIAADGAVRAVASVSNVSLELEEPIPQVKEFLVNSKK